jgi:hypothetical protein
VEGTPTPDPDVSSEPADGPGAAPRFTRGRVLAGLLVLGLAVAAIAVLTATRKTGPVTLPLPSGVVPPSQSGDGTLGSGGGPAPTGPGVAPPNPVATRGASAGPSAGPSVSPSESPPPTTSEPVAPLTARYATIGQNVLGLSGYTGQVRIANPGTGLVSGWQVVITLPNGATVANPSGAQAQQNRGTVTFTPTDDTRDVGGGASVEFTFDVTGLLAGPPTGCAIDGRPCD